MTCDCGHRRPGGMTLIDQWFEHEQSHVNERHPVAGQFSSIDVFENPAILPPLTTRIRYLA